MLVYVRKRDIDSVTAPVNLEDYDQAIPLLLEKEQEEERARTEQERQEKLITTVSYVALEDLKEHHTYDLIPDSTLGTGFPSFRNVKIRKNDSFVIDLKTEIAHQLGLQNVDLWSCQRRRNGTVRPHSRLIEDNQYLHYYLNVGYFLALPVLPSDGTLILIKTLLPETRIPSHGFANQIGETTKLTIVVFDRKDS